MTTELDDDDLDYYSLPVVGPAEYHELGQCVRSKKPYEGELEKMIIGINPEKDYYRLQVVEPDGKAGYREKMGIKDVHYYYERV